MMFMRGPTALSNEAMVRDLENSRTLSSPECIAAFRRIDRKHFWVRESADFAYADMPLRHGRLHQSAPHIYAKALESMMPLKPGMSFLNVGAGTGYFSSIVAELCGPDAISDGLDIWEETVEHARDRCQKLGKEQIHFAVGNVYQLDVEQGMRYDRIYLGACANARSKYLYRLLEIGGVLVGPFRAGNMQQLRRVTRRTEAHFAVEVLNTVQFATLVEPSPDTTQQGAAIEDMRAVGLKGVPFTFALRERPWAPERNLAYPVKFRRIVRTMLFGRPNGQSVASLPPEIWSNHILPYCARMWFDVPDAVPIPPPSKVRMALDLFGEAVKKKIFRRRSSCESVSEADGDSDGGSTHASSVGTPVRVSRFGSDMSFGSLSSQNSPQTTELTLYEALGDGPTHAIGSSGDPDEINTHSGLLVALLENDMNAADEGEDEPAEEPPVRGIWNFPPLRAIRQCIGWCLVLMPRVRQRPQLRA